MDGIKLEPLRTLDEFILKDARFQAPNVGDLDRWANRIKENLIYYQTNYFLTAIIIFLIVGVLHPAQMLLGICVVTALMFGYNYLTKNQRVVRDLKNSHPLVCLMVILLGGYLLISLMGSVLVFVFGILLPFVAIFIHASLRLRDSKQKLSNLKEKLSLRPTPMGMILEELGMAFEGFSNGD